MYRVSSYIRHFARALLAGAVIATLWVNLAPASYYDALEWRLFPLPLPGWLIDPNARATAITLVSDLFMALFVFVIGKELWEAHMLERGALRGQRAALPLFASLGAMAGGVAVWVLVSALFVTAEEARFATGWPLPIGCDVVLCYVTGRLVFGPGHPALHMLLLITIGCDLAGLLVLGLLLPAEPLRLWWLLLPLLASLTVWLACGRHARAVRETRRQRALHLWPYLLAGAVSWIGVSAAGLPGALGLLPVIPAIPHSERTFGLFAEAEELLHDPLNRIAHLMVPAMTLVLFLFGLTRGGIDPAALAPTTFAALAAFWIGKPLGLLAGAALAQRLPGVTLPEGIRPGDLARIALIAGLGFTVPLIAIDSALPGGAMAEAARLGIALSLLIAPAALLLARR